MDVIELSSSPEPSHLNKSSAATRKRRYPDRHIVIELTDTEGDDESHPPSPKKGKKAVRSAPTAGPSRLKGSPSLQLMARPSTSKARLTTPTRPFSRNTSSTRSLSQQKTLPLFYPSEDEKTTDRSQSKSQPRLQVQHAGTSTRNLELKANDDIARTPSRKPAEEAIEVRADSPEIDPMDTHVARVLEIIPDVRLDHLVSLIMRHLPTSKDKVVDAVVTALCEDTTYPKSEKKGKRRRTEDGTADDERASSKVKIDYANKERNYEGGVVYERMALDQLFIDFPRIPLRRIRKAFYQNRRLYAPTHIFLDDLQKKGKLRITNSSPRKTSKADGKKPEHPEFQAELQWLVEYKQGRDVPTAKEGVVDELEYDESGDGIECGCCFSTYTFEKMIQCQDAHLFCRECITSYASGLLGSHNPNLVCMDQSGCKLPFPESELRRILSKKLMELYDRIRQTKELEAAGLDNLEECPFCEYKVVIENENEKLFHCENEDCGAVTCRECKKMDHLPKSCKEMQEDKNLDGRHQVEEAMTRALMRNCPKCQKAFIKDYGCNKMTCPHCYTLSCYNCRQAIQGYDHFDQSGPGAPSTSKRCKLWEPIEQRHHEEVAAAAKRALAEYKQEHPEVDEKDIKVDLAPAPPPLPQPPAGVHQNVAQFAPLPPLPVLPVQRHNGFPQLQPPQPVGGLMMPMRGRRRRRRR